MGARGIMQRIATLGSSRCPCCGRGQARGWVGLLQSSGQKVALCVAVAVMMLIDAYRLLPVSESGRHMATPMLVSLGGS